MSFLKSKTMWFAFLTGVTGLVQQVAPFIPEKYTGAVVTTLGIATAALRLMTTQPLAEK
jgi:hypothetical protein